MIIVVEEKKQDHVDIFIYTEANIEIVQLISIGFGLHNYTQPYFQPSALAQMQILSVLRKLQRNPRKLTKFISYKLHYIPPSPHIVLAIEKFYNFQTI